MTALIGEVVPKSNAPRCHKCGRYLWSPGWIGNEHSRDDNGIRLGRVLEYRLLEVGAAMLPICRNVKGCAKRAKESHV